MVKSVQRDHWEWKRKARGCGAVGQCTRVYGWLVGQVRPGPAHIMSSSRSGTWSPFRSLFLSDWIGKRSNQAWPGYSMCFVMLLPGGARDPATRHVSRRRLARVDWRLESQSVANVPRWRSIHLARPQASRSLCTPKQHHSAICIKLQTTNCGHVWLTETPFAATTA